MNELEQRILNCENTITSLSEVISALRNENHRLAASCEDLLGLLTKRAPAPPPIDLSADFDAIHERLDALSTPTKDPLIQAAIDLLDTRLATLETNFRRWREDDRLSITRAQVVRILNETSRDPDPPDR